MFLAFSAFIQSGYLSGNYAISKMNIKTISQLLLHVKRKNRDKNKYFLTLLYYFCYLFNFLGNAVFLYCGLSGVEHIHCIQYIWNIKVFLLTPGVVAEYACVHTAR